VSYRSGGRRPRHRLRFTSALRAEIQRGSSMQQSHTLLLLYSPMSVLAAAKQTAAKRGLLRLGSLRLHQRRGLADTSHPSVFSHTEPTPTNKRQAAARSLTRSTLCCVSSTIRSPSQRVCRYGSRQQRQPPCLGSLVLWQAPSRPYDLPPSRGVGRSARPCDSPAGVASQMPSGPPHRLALRFA
jgi:hypothetical protein